MSKNKKPKDQTDTKTKSGVFAMTEVPEDTVGSKDCIPKKETEDKPKKKLVKKPDITNQKPSVALKIFCSLSGKKPDQIAGFRRYAMTQKFGPMTIKQWREELVKFQNKPTR